MDTSAQARQLIRNQQEEWDLARSNYTSLKNIKVRKLPFNGFDLKVQFNPERIRSSAAKVDTKSIEARPCFLCRKNLPKQQKGIPVLEKYILLVNPFPIFPEHLTIPNKDHIDQRIKNSFEDMLDLAELLEDFTVFYNGPKCGASAPDHLHFQAGIKNFMPIEKDFIKGTFLRGSDVVKDVEIISWSSYLRTLVTLTSRNKKSLIGIFEQLYTSLNLLQKDEPEPMLNILCSWHSGRWTVHVFPRKLHRPRQYFQTGANQIVFSPASVDMGGVLITPREEDFNKLSTDLVKDIFSQVCLDDTNLDPLIRVLTKP